MDSVFTTLGSIEAGEAVGALGLGSWPKHWVERNVLDSELPRDISNLPGPWYQNYVLVVPSIGRLREVLPLFSAEGRAKQIAVVIETGEPSQPFYSGLAEQAGENLYIEALEIFPQAKVVRMTTNGWLDVHAVLSVLAAQGRQTLPLGGLRLGVIDPEFAVWAAADPQARWQPAASEDDAVEPVKSMDVIVGRAYSTATELLPPIDPYSCSPIGFDAFPEQANARLIPRNGGLQWVLDTTDTGDGMNAAFDVRTGSFTEAHIGRLRNYQNIHVTGLETVEPRAAARSLSQLAVSGVPITFEEVEPQTRELLGEPVFNALRAFASSRSSALARESASISSRRTALRTFLPRYRGSELRRRAGLAALEEPTVSVLLATKRPSMVVHALSQIATQTLPQVETILVLHGVDELGPEGDAAIAAFTNPLTVLRVPASATLGGALNAGLAVAAGTYVAKMDDDDWYGPHHLEDLFLAREYSDAVLVGSPVEFTYLEGPDITTRRSHTGEQYTHHVAGGTMFISRHALTALGGWRNTRSAVDRGLLDAVLASNGRVFRNHGQNYMMHRRSFTGNGLGHTWQADDSIFLQDVREQWNGFYPAPQLEIEPREPSDDQRSPDYRSWFSTQNHAQL